ncbi:MAG: 16S rRNA (uracil(1498)-N(3))-methyltransferase [Pseudomonadota bacterium]
MRTSRIYQHVDLAENSTVTLTDAAAHYLSNVLRLSINDPITIFNGRGGEYDAKIIALQKKQVQIKIGKFHATDRESPCNIHLAQCLLRNEKMDLVIQKATELGVAQITPIISEYCNIQLSTEKQQKRQQRWQEIIIHACEQCGRNILPRLNAPIQLQHWVSTQTADLKLIFHTENNDVIHATKPNSIIALIGSEGGLSETEVLLAKQYGFQSASLGPRILRTETAAIAAVAVLQNRWGDL